MTLTQTAIITKQIINFIAVTLILGTIFFIGYRIWYTHYLSTLPPVEEKPDTKFGILPLVNFPKSQVSSSNFSYSLDTATGGLPKIGQDPGFEKLIKVYFVIKPYATFLSPDKSQALAEKFGINAEPEIINETIYSFEQENKHLTVDLDSGNFKYSNEASPSSEEKFDTQESLISNFKHTLESLGVLKEELKEGRAKVTTKGSDSNTSVVSLWPKDLDKKILFSSDTDKSQIYAEVFSQGRSLENYLLINFTFYQIDTSTFATYPTKTPEEALDDLKSGKGVVILEPQNPKVSITSLSLDYFLPEDYNPYIQPIYIFEGPSFMAYIPAVSSQFQKQD
ncbi:MAG: hypothetical protein AAB414_01305 [Patescibacteria group bacterium]